MVGETTGRKLDPVTVAREMKTARQDGNGERLFSSSALLTATQMQSFFSRRARCGRFSENDPENQEAVQEGFMVGMVGETTGRKLDPVTEDGNDALLTEESWTSEGQL